MDLTQDLHDGVRSLRAHPGITLVALLTLALGIGANTAIFSIVNGVLLRPLPYAEPERLVTLDQISPTFGRSAMRNYATYRDGATQVEGMAGYVTSVRVEEGVSAERVKFVQPERSLFRLLGVSAVAGRTFQDDDPLDVMVVGAALARRRYGGAVAAIGQHITLEGTRYTVVGVMGDAFQFPYSTEGPLGVGRAEMWAPLPPPANPRSAMEGVIARLRPGVSARALTAELNGIAQRVAAEQPEMRGAGVAVTPLAEAIAGTARPRLLVLLSAVGLVLLAACANVANLLLVRASTRAREIAVRGALGADRLRLVRQFLAESLVLSGAGGVAGLVVAFWGSSVLARLAAFQLPQGVAVGLDWRVFLFLFSVCLATGLAFGLAPALVAAQTDINVALKSGTGARGSGFFFRRFRSALAVAEVALACVLVLGGALLIRELIRIRHVDPGFNTANVLTMHLSPNVGREQVSALLPRVEALPGVRAAAFAQMLPLQSWGWNATFSFPGAPALAPADRPVIELRYVTPRYFETLGIPIKEGRAFTAGDIDAPNVPKVVIVNETTVRKYFGGRDPVGVVTDRGVVVGVAADVRQAGLNQTTLADVYYPVAQNVATMRNLGMSLIVSTQMTPTAMAAPVRHVVRSTYPNLAMFGVKTMDEIVEDSLADANLYVWLVGTFAALALLLACAGIYGVMSSVVAARTREFGVRLALGQSPGALQALILRQAGVLIGIGLAIGLGAGVVSARYLDSLIAGAGTLRPATAAAAAAGLAVVALVACLGPARRAARVDPIVALRAE